MTGTERSLIPKRNGVPELAGVSIAGALVTALSALTLGYQALPPTDGAYGTGLWLIVDPFVILIGGMGVALGSLVAFLGSLILMRRVPLWDGSLIVITSVLLSMALLAPVIGYLMIGPAIVVTLVSMALCRVWVELVPSTERTGAFPRAFMWIVKASLLALGLVTLARGCAYDANLDLLRAAGADNFEQAKSALDAGANPNFQGPHRDTALMRAADNARPEIARLLIERGASLELTSRLDRTPIMWAARSGNFSLVQFYINRGASLSAQDRMGQNASEIARAEGFAQLSELLEPHETSGP